VTQWHQTPTKAKTKYSHFQCACWGQRAKVPGKGKRVGRSEASIIGARMCWSAEAGLEEKGLYARTVEVRRMRSDRNRGCILS
jgi:hypothetical protein